MTNFFISLVLLNLTSNLFAEENSFVFKIKTTPYYGVTITLNNEPWQSLPSSTQPKVTQVSLPYSQLSDKNQMTICFDHSASLNKKPGVLNLGQVLMHQSTQVTENKKPALMANVLAPAGSFFQPGKQECKNLYFTKEAVITEDQFNTKQVTAELIQLQVSPEAQKINIESVEKQAAEAKPEAEPTQEQNVASPTPQQLNQQQLNAVMKEIEQIDKTTGGLINKEVEREPTATKPSGP